MASCETPNAKTIIRICPLLLTGILYKWQFPAHFGSHKHCLKSWFTNSSSEVAPSIGIAMMMYSTRLIERKKVKKDLVFILSVKGLTYIWCIPYFCVSLLINKRNGLVNRLIAPFFLSFTI